MFVAIAGSIFIVVHANNPLLAASGIFQAYLKRARFPKRPSLFLMFRPEIFFRLQVFFLWNLEVLRAFPKRFCEER